MKLKRLKKISKKMSNESGMTLIEILIVLALMAGMGTVIGVNVVDRYNQGKVRTAKIQISNFESALDDFARENGRYPTTSEGLFALIENPGDLKNYNENGYIKQDEIPLDPFGYEYDYESDGSGKYKIISYGADGKEGGEGYNADITN